MQCDSLMIDEDLQWLCCAESYFFLGDLQIKEICILCIQTGEYYTWHIIPSLNSDNDVNLYSPESQEIYKLQLEKHGLAWFVGNYFIHEVFDMMFKILSTNNTIFVIDKVLEAWLEKRGFNDVQRLYCVPMKCINEMPNSTCRQFCHDVGFTYCAQRKCFEIMNHLRPVLQPSLKPNSFKYVYSIEKADSSSLKPGTRAYISSVAYQFENNLYEQLTALAKNADVCGKLSMAWQNGDGKGNDAGEAASAM